jgi:hypothetical protein
LFPKIESLRYLDELKTLLEWLNENECRSYVFFRQCTLPSTRILELIKKGEHEIGLHLEDSRSFESYIGEKNVLEKHIGTLISAMSKHGSGNRRYGRRHYAPYEPEKYVDWAERSGIRIVFGNLENPALPPTTNGRVRFFPSAFWIEPAWRNTTTFPISWLRERIQQHDVVLLVHPENLLASVTLQSDFYKLLRECTPVIL